MFPNGIKYKNRAARIGFIPEQGTSTAIPLPEGGESMKGLLIKDRLRWRDCCSASIGSQLQIRDSSFDLRIFEKHHNPQDILKVIGEAPEDAYQIPELEEVPQDRCEFIADSGTCYRQKS
jgi:hypothetical protein